MAIFDALFWALNGFASVNLHHEDESVLILRSKHKYVHLKTHWASHTMHQNLAVILRQFIYGKNSFIVLIPVMNLVEAAVTVRHQDESVLILSSKHKYVHLKTHWASHTIYQILWQFNYGKNSFIVLTLLTWALERTISAVWSTICLQFSQMAFNHSLTAARAYLMGPFLL